LSEHTQGEFEAGEADFKLGDLVRGERWDTKETVEGIIIGFDDGDDTYEAIIVNDGTVESSYVLDASTGTVKIDKLPEKLIPLTGSRSPEHVFVVTDGENVRVYATPEAVLAEGNIADDPLNRRTLMEAIADPGERHPLAADLHVTFEAVKGAER